MRNKLRQVLLFIAVLLCSSITQTVTASQVATNPTFVDTNINKKVTPKASSNFSGHNKLKKRMTKWAIGGVVTLFCIYGVYRLLKHSSSDKHDSNTKDDRDDHDIDENHVLTIEELQNMFPKYTIDPDPIENLILDEEDRNEIYDILKEEIQTIGILNSIELCDRYATQVAQPLRRIVENNNIREKKLVDLYAYLFLEGFKGANSNSTPFNLIDQLISFEEPLTGSFLASCFLHDFRPTNVPQYHLSHLAVRLFRAAPDKWLKIFVTLMHHDQNDNIRINVIHALAYSKYVAGISRIYETPELNEPITDSPLLLLLEEAMQDHNLQVKIAAIECIGLLKIESDNIIPILLEAAKTTNTNVDVQAQAMRALARLRAVEGIPLVMDILQKEENEKKIKSAASLFMAYLREYIPIQYLDTLIAIQEKEENTRLKRSIERVIENIENRYGIHDVAGS